MFESWFEDLTDNQAGSIPKAGRANQERHILEKLINPRRARWGELLAWAAFVISEEDSDLASDMAVNAKLLLGETPLEELPLAKVIAKNTLAAAIQR